MSSISNVRCPRCQTRELWKFGRDPKTGKQKYRCKKCRAQFVPRRPLRQSRYYPLPVCPWCGARMGIYKHLSDATRFRCSNYNAPG